jgi:spermidine synthase
MLLLAAAFGSGAAFFAFEVLWTHLIAIVLGSSVYAFSIMLLMVLAGLLAAARWVKRAVTLGRPMFWGQALMASGAMLLLEFRLWDLGQIAFLWTPPEALRTFWFAEAVKLALGALLIVPAAAALGTIFPSLLDSKLLKQEGRTHLVGYLNAANSVGCLAGAALGLFVLIPGLGAELSMKLLTVLLLVLGVVATRMEQPKRLGRELATAAVLVALLSVTGWNRFILTSGANVYFGSDTGLSGEGPAKAGPVEMTFWHEDAQGGITTVLESEIDGRRCRTLKTNGKFQGRDDLRTEGQAQFGFSAVPALVAGNFRRALLIGLGTGHSASALRVLGYDQVEIAELSAGITEAARTRFAHLNERILERPGVTTHIEDGRNVLLTAQPGSFDLIAVELTSIWFSGATNLYSREFYELARSRMRADGVMQQWVQVHHIGSAELDSAVATMRTVFPQVSLWYFGGQGILIGTNGPQNVPAGRLQELASRLGRNTRQLLEPPEKLMARVAAARALSPAAVDAILAAGPVINTDHNRWIEYSTPRYNASTADWRTANLERFARLERRYGRP